MQQEWRVRNGWDHSFQVNNNLFLSTIVAQVYRGDDDIASFFNALHMVPNPFDGFAGKVRKEVHSRPIVRSRPPLGDTARCCCKRELIDIFNGLHLHSSRTPHWKKPRGYLLEILLILLSEPLREFLFFEGDDYDVHHESVNDRHHAEGR